MSMYFEEIELPIELSDDEKTTLRARNAEIDINMINAKEALDLAKGQFKEATEKIKKEKSNNLQILRQGYENRRVKVAEYVNETDATIEFSNEEGTIVHVRPLTLAERRDLRIQFNQRSNQDV